MDKTGIGDRMKKYENITRYVLTKRIPVILRLDGKSFHTVTRKRYGRKYSSDFYEIMMKVSEKLYKEIQGCTLLYSQSDEINCLLTDYKTIVTEGWFDYNLSKIISISSCIAGVEFSKLFGDSAYFDARAFSIPFDEVCNYFIWRQQDATRNAIQFAAREIYSQKELHKKNTLELQELLFKKGINFNNLPTVRKRGFCINKGEQDFNIPIFSKNREYIENHVFIRED